MTVEEFKATLSATEAPDVVPALRALWHDGRGDWALAHRTAQDVDDASGAWVHAYLHRKEGDLANAAYWYRQARQPVATDSLSAEWERIVTALLPGT
jgi:hypothetical protein